MELLDVNDYIFDGEKRTWYDVKYRDKIYRRYNGYWSAVYSDGAAGYGSVEIGFQSHLEKVWQKTYGDKKIYKKVELVIE